MSWIGVDLDGTLAHYDRWKTHDHIGEPIPLMVDRVKAWIKEGKQVKIFTARVSEADPIKLIEIKHAIEVWCLTHIGFKLPITNAKDWACIEIWDDIAVRVEKNTGIIG